MGRSHTIWRGPAESCKKNGAGVTSANKFIHNLEYKQDIKKRRETCKLKWRLLGRGRKRFLTIRFVVRTNVARIKLPSLTKQVQNNIYSFYKIPQALSKSSPSHDTRGPAEEAGEISPCGISVKWDKMGYSI